MNVLALILYAVICHALGLGILALVCRDTAKLGLLERYSLAGCIGMGGIYLVGIFCLSVHWEIGPGLVVGTTCVLWAVVLCLKYPVLDLEKLKTACKQRKSFSLSWFEWALVFYICFQLSYILFSAFWRPVAMNDDWAQWAGNAKYLFFHGAVDQTYFRETNLSSYPLFIAINEVVLCKLYGEWCDFLCKGFLVILLIDFVGYIYSYIRRDYNRLMGLFSAFIVVTIPTYVRTGLNGTAEIPLSLFIALCAMIILRYLESGKWNDIIIAGVLGGVVASIKSEGIYVMIAISPILVFAAWKEKTFNIKHLLAFWGIILLFFLPWVLLKFSGGCADSRMTIFSLKWIYDIDSYVGMLRAWFAMLIPSKHLLLTGIYFVAALLFWMIKNRKDHFTSYLLLMIAGIGVVYAIGCYSTGWPGQYSRLLSHFLGLMLLVIMRQLSAYWHQLTSISFFD